MMTKNLNNLAKVKKPIVEREGKNVKVCHFHKQTNECFKKRCFWLKYGGCKIYSKKFAN